MIYKCITGNNSSELNSKVEEAIKDGFVPHGSPSCSISDSDTAITLALIQAMIKPVETPAKTPLSKTEIDVILKNNQLRGEDIYYFSRDIEKAHGITYQTDPTS